MVQQNLFYAFGFAGLGGFMQVLTVVILAYPQFLKAKKGKSFSPALEKVFLAGNIGTQILSGVVNTISTWYGPVSLVLPIRVSAQLLFNMILFGLLQIEEFPKDVRVGTYIVVTGAMLLSFVGPTAQANQDAVALMEHTPAVVWTLFLIGLTFSTGYYCVVWLSEKNSSGIIKHPHKFAILLTARVITGVLSTSLSKLLAVTSGFLFCITLGLFIGVSFVISSVAILQATEVDQAMFVPAAACGIQITNTLTGLLIWQDYLVVQTWVGYITVLTQIILGVYLISSIDAYSSSADSNFALAQSVKIQYASEFAEKKGKSLGKSLVGGSLDSMLAPIVEDDDEIDNYFEERRRLYSNYPKYSEEFTG